MRRGAATPLPPGSTATPAAGGAAPRARARARLGQKDPVASTRMYYWWLLLALFAEYARPASYFSFLNVPLLYSAIPIALLVVSLFVKDLRPLKEMFQDRIAKWMFILLGLVMFSAVYADVTLYTWNTFKLVGGYIILAVLVFRIAFTEARLRGVFVVLLAAHLFLLAMNPEVVTQPETRHYITGATFLGDGNDYALSLCILIPLTIEMALAMRNKVLKIVAWAGLALTVLAVVGTQSRGATLGLGAVLIYLWLNSPKKAPAFFGVLIIALGGLAYAPEAYFNRMSTIGDQNEGSAQGRIQAWQAGVAMAMSNPLLGVGAGQFPTSFGTKFASKEGAHAFKTAHSTYFLVLGELAIPGIVCVCMLVFGTIRANLRMRRVMEKNKPPDAAPRYTETIRLLHMLTAATIGFAVAGAFLSATWYPHMYILASLGIAVRGWAKQMLPEQARAEFEPARKGPRAKKRTAEPKK